MDQPAPHPAARHHAGFDLFGPAIPDRPVILSVPHAGRDYSPDLLAQARVRRPQLQRLEDRWADLLVQPLIARGFTVVVARAPRALIDLNRHEQEIDPAMLVGVPHDAALRSSVKLRGGLGLVPRRMAGIQELWQRPLPWTEAQRRIDIIHRPYHAALERLMSAARDMHGHAILIDLHSMPPLAPPAAGQAAATMVLGDRFGRTAAARLLTLASDVAAGHGLIAAQNHPYAGDYLIERHGQPERGLHAIQVEVDRTLYLDAALDQPGPGLGRVQGVIVALAESLATELPRADDVLAAE